MPPDKRFCASCGAFNDPSAPLPPAPLPPAPAVNYYPSYPQQQHIPVKPRRSIGRTLVIAAGVLLLACVGLSMLANVGNGSANTTSGTGAAGGSRATATKEPPDYLAATLVDPRLIASSPSSYIGTNLYIQGKALTVTQYADYTWVQVMAGIPGKDYDTESLVVELRPKVNVLKGDCYKIYAVGLGTQKVTRTLTGADNEVPLLGGYRVQTVSSSGACPAPR